MISYLDSWSMDVQVQNKLQTFEQMRCLRTKDTSTCHVSQISYKFHDMRVELRKTSTKHLNIFLSVHRHCFHIRYSLFEIYREEKCIARQFSVIIGWYLTIDRAPLSVRSRHGFPRFPREFRGNPVIVPPFRNDDVSFC